ncbi:hypothetical protein [Anaerotruncus rubiinfantis]|uniref:hypothetical protein n=1 Tax=Anaerotruncus rubiinfantis TaxID=1720200 RepID=UPI0011C88047|nr:hypothetical protein [Anaerotruncus rubiinfantis]
MKDYQKSVIEKIQAMTPEMFYEFVMDLCNTYIEAKSRPHYTEQDIAIMRGRVAEGTPWVARDDDKFLCAYKEEPERIRVGWYTDDDYYDINNDLLSWIKPGECVDLREILREME